MAQHLGSWKPKTARQYDLQKERYDFFFVNNSDEKKASRAIAQPSRSSAPPCHLRHLSARSHRHLPARVTSINACRGLFYKKFVSSVPQAVSRSGFLFRTPKIWRYNIVMVMLWHESNRVDWRSLSNCGDIFLWGKSFLVFKINT